MSFEKPPSSPPNPRVRDVEKVIRLTKLNRRDDAIAGKKPPKKEPKGVIQAEGGDRIDDFIWKLIVEAETEPGPTIGSFQDIEFTVSRTHDFIDPTNESEKKLQESFDKAMKQFTEKRAMKKNL